MASPLGYEAHRCGLPEQIPLHARDEVLVPAGGSGQFAVFFGFLVTPGRLAATMRLTGLTADEVLTYHDRLVIAVVSGRNAYSGTACSTCYRPLARRPGLPPSSFQSRGITCTCGDGVFEASLGEGAYPIVFDGGGIRTTLAMRLELSD